MKKLILTSVTILLIGITAYGQDGGKCSKKCDNTSNQKQCAKEQSCIDVYGLNAFTSEKKCVNDKTIAKNADCKSNARKLVKTNDSKLISYNKK